MFKSAILISLAAVVLADVSSLPNLNYRPYQSNQYNQNYRQNQYYQGFNTRRPQYTPFVTNAPQYTPAVTVQPQYQPITGRNWGILRFDNDANPDGSYRYAYETENGISAEEQGVPKQVGSERPVVVQGSFQYTSPEGQPIQLTYTADENGFQPQGNALPTPPPIPEAILRSIRFNEANNPGNTRQL